MTGLVLKYQGQTGYKSYFNTDQGWVTSQKHATIYPDVTALIQAVSLKSNRGGQSYFSVGVGCKFVIVKFSTPEPIEFIETLLLE